MLPPPFEASFPLLGHICLLNTSTSHPWPIWALENHGACSQPNVWAQPLGTGSSRGHTFPPLHSWPKHPGTGSKVNRDRHFLCQGQKDLHPHPYLPRTAGNSIPRLSCQASHESPRLASSTRGRRNRSAACEHVSDPSPGYLSFGPNPDPGPLMSPQRILSSSPSRTSGARGRHGMTCSQNIAAFPPALPKRCWSGGVRGPPFCLHCTHFYCYFYLGKTMLIFQE